MKQDNRAVTGRNVGDHLANERTFLAWIRTSIGIMGFGFVVVKFSLFIKQIGAALGTKPNMPSHGYSEVIGILLVALGGLMIIFSYLRYNNTKKQLDNGDYFHATSFVKITAVFIFISSILLLMYLIKTT